MDAKVRASDKTVSVLGGNKQNQIKRNVEVLETLNIHYTLELIGSVFFRDFYVYNFFSGFKTVDLIPFLV